MKICFLNKNSCVYQAFKNPRLKTFFVVLAKTVFSPWKLGSKKVLNQWKFVFVGKKEYSKAGKSKSFKRRDSSLSKKSTNSSESFVKDPVLSKQEKILKMMLKHNEFPVENMQDITEKATKLADTILNEAHKLSSFGKLEEDAISKSKKAGCTVSSQELLFRRCFKSLMELKVQQTKDDFRPATKGKSLSKLFGDNIFQIKKDNGEITFVAFQERVGKGSFNEAFFGFDLFSGETYVGRRNLTALNQKQIGELKRENLFQKQLSLYPELKDNVVGVFASVYQNPYYGTLLENCDGGDICTLKENGQLSGQEKREIVDAVVAFISNMHARKFVYGDFKTENLLLKNGKVKAADFGGAYDSVKGSSPNIATPYYLAPEIFATCATTAKTDLWALGIFLYEMKYHLGSKRRVPQFFDKVFTKVENFKKVNTKSLQEARKILANGLQQPNSFLDTKDPYDQVIIQLLKMDPNKRISAARALELLRKTPLASYSK